MRVVKFYREHNGKVVVGRFRFTAYRGEASIVYDSVRAGWTRRRPKHLGPHQHPAQRPGYHPPSAQQLRRARQTLRKGNQWPR